MDPKVNYRKWRHYDTQYRYKIAFDMAPKNSV